MRPEIGLHLDINLHDYATLNRALPMLRQLQMLHVRLPINLLDQHRPNADTFYHRLFHSLRHFHVLPVITTPPMPLSPADLLDLKRSDEGPPERQGDLRNVLADFVDHFLDRHGHYFDEIQIGDELDPTRFHLPRNRATLRPDGPLVLNASLLHRAAARAEHHGKRVIFPGLCPIDPAFVAVLDQLGALEHCDVIAAHVPPDTLTWADGSPFRSFLDIQRRLARVSARPAWITRAAPTPATCEAHTQRGNDVPAPPPASEAEFLHDAAYAPFERLYLDASSLLPPSADSPPPPAAEHLQQLIAHKRQLDRQQYLLA